MKRQHCAERDCFSSCLPPKGTATELGKLRASRLSSLRFSNSLKFTACICAGANRMIQRAQHGSPGPGTGSPGAGNTRE